MARLLDIWVYMRLYEHGWHRWTFKAFDGCKVWLLRGNLGFMWFGRCGELELYIPLIVAGFYALFSIELGWSERFFTLGLYVYALALSATGVLSLSKASLLPSRDNSCPLSSLYH